jgi:acetylornithine deacetylase/succinyl-diaminopimelate desuccinylase-like protein
VIRVLAAIVVLAVAAFAAIVSYSHIFELGRHHGQDGTAARLLPLSVDGLIAAASLVMLHAARRELGVPHLARAMLALGVGATVAANVGYGMPSGWLAAVVSAWPAVAFVGSVEMAVRFTGDARHAGASAQDNAADKMADKMADSPASDARQAGPLASGSAVPCADRTADRPPRQRAAIPPGRAKAAAILKRHPGMGDPEVAKRAGVSERTVARAKRDMNGDAP